MFTWDTSVWEITVCVVQFAANSTTAHLKEILFLQEITAWTSLDQDLVQVQIVVLILDSFFQQFLCEIICSEALPGVQDWERSHKMGMYNCTEDHGYSFPNGWGAYAVLVLMKE